MATFPTVYHGYGYQTFMTDLFPSAQIHISKHAVSAPSSQLKAVDREAGYRAFVLSQLCQVLGILKDV